jgi:hypothetical protein
MTALTTLKTARAGADSMQEEPESLTADRADQGPARYFGLVSGQHYSREDLVFAGLCEVL